MAVRKRVVNDELCDIWALMMYEKPIRQWRRKKTWYMMKDIGGTTDI